MIMKIFVPTILAFTLSSPVANAQSCGDLAAQAAAQQSGEVVAVAAKGSNCKIKVRIPGKNGNPPRVESITIKK